MSNNENQVDRIDPLLNTIFFRASCPEPDTLLQHAMGQLHAIDAKRLTSHLADCGFCSAELKTLMPPERVVDRVKQWLANLVGNRPLQTAIPQTNFRPSMALKGSSEKQHIFQSQDYRLTLAVRGEHIHGTGYELEGTVVNVSDPLEMFSGSVHLLSEDGKETQAKIDDFGTFTIANLPSNQYAVVVQLGSTTVTIDELIIK